MESKSGWSGGADFHVGRKILLIKSHKERGQEGDWWRWRAGLRVDWTVENPTNTAQESINFDPCKFLYTKIGYFRVMIDGNAMGGFAEVETKSWEGIPTPAFCAYSVLCRFLWHLEDEALMLPYFAALPLHQKFNEVLSCLYLPGSGMNVCCPFHPQ